MPSNPDERKKKQNEIKRNRKFKWKLYVLMLVILMLQLSLIAWAFFVCAQNTRYWHTIVPVEENHSLSLRLSGTFIQAIDCWCASFGAIFLCCYCCCYCCWSCWLCFIFLLFAYNFNIHSYRKRHVAFRPCVCRTISDTELREPLVNGIV